MLTRQDVDCLIDAVEAWEKSGNEGRMIGSLIGSMMCRDDEQRKKVEQEFLAREEEGNRKAKTMKERGVLLRAKLIALRDSMDASSFLDSGGIISQRT